MEAKATTTFPEQWPYHEGLRRTRRRSGSGFRLGGGELCKQSTAAAEPKTVTAGRNLFFDAIARVTPAIDRLNLILPEAQIAFAVRESRKRQAPTEEPPEWLREVREPDCSEAEWNQHWWESECDRRWERWMRERVTPFSHEFGLADGWTLDRIVTTFQLWTRCTPGDPILRRWARVYSEWKPHGTSGKIPRLHGTPPALPEDPRTFKLPGLSDTFYFERWQPYDWTWKLYREEIIRQFSRHLRRCKDKGEPTRGAVKQLREQLETDRAAIEAWHLWKGDIRTPAKLAGKLTEVDTDLPSDRHFLWLARRQCNGERPGEIGARDGVGRSTVEMATIALAERINLEHLRRWRPGPR